jgi:hypothetical protein
MFEAFLSDEQHSGNVTIGTKRRSATVGNMASVSLCIDVGTDE